MKTIRVIKSSHEKDWYNNRIGDIFEVYSHSQSNYYTMEIKDKDGCISLIKKVDTEELTRKDKLKRIIDGI